MNEVAEYIIKNEKSGRYLIAIGNKEKAPSSGIWDVNLNKAKPYNEQEALKIAQLLNEVYGNSMGLEAVVLSPNELVNKVKEIKIK